MLDQEVVTILLESPDTQLDASMKDLIRNWSAPPTATQILEVLDFCIHGSLASTTMVTLFQLAFLESCKREGITPESVEKKAVWRIVGPDWRNTL